MGRELSGVWHPQNLAAVDARGHANTLKRLLVHTGALNLGLLMRTLNGVGTPHGLQGRVVAVLTLVVALWTRLIDCWCPFDTPLIDNTSVCPMQDRFEQLPVGASEWVV